MVGAFTLSLPLHRVRRRKLAYALIGVISFTAGLAVGLFWGIAGAI